MKFQINFLKILFILSICFFCQIEMKGQYVEWEKKILGSGSNSYQNVLQTKDKGYLIYGTSTSFDGDFTQNNGLKDYSLIKIDSLGKKEWAKNYGGTKVDDNPTVIETKSGELLIVGTTYSSDDGDYKGTQNKVGQDIGIIKINKKGELIFSTIYGSSGGDSSNGNIFETVDSNFVLNLNIGEGMPLNWKPDLDFKDGNTLKIDKTGKLIWVKKFNYYDQVMKENYLGINKVDSKNAVFTLFDKNEKKIWEKNYIVYNSYDDSFAPFNYPKMFHKISDKEFCIQLIDTTQNGQKYSSIFIMHDKNGNEKWSKKVNLTNNYYEGVNKMFKDGNFYYYYETLPLSSSNYQYHVVKFDFNGNIIFDKNYGGTNNDILEETFKLQNNDFLLIGKSNSYDGDFSQNNGGQNDIGIIKIDSLGNVIWAKNYGGNSSEGNLLFKPVMKDDNIFFFLKGRFLEIIPIRLIQNQILSLQKKST